MGTCKTRSHKRHTTSRAVDRKDKVVVGVNKYVDDTLEPPDVFPIDAQTERHQIERTQHVRAHRNQPAVDTALAELAKAARGTQNLLYPMREALRLSTTVGDISDVLRHEFGTYCPT